MERKESENRLRNSLDRIPTKPPPAPGNTRALLALASRRPMLPAESDV